MDCAINSPGHVNIVLGRLNETDKRILKEQMELLGKLASNDTSDIQILLIASKYVSFELVDQSLHVLNHKYR